MHINLGLADRHAGVCISRIRWLSPELKAVLQKEDIWEDLIQELYSAAFEAWRSGMNDSETRRFAQRRIYAFLKAYGFRRYRSGYFKFERHLAEHNIIDPTPQDNTITRYACGEDLTEKILDLLRKHPEGLSRREIMSSLQVPSLEFNWYLAPMIKRGKVLEIQRENTRGRPLSPLLVLAEQSQKLPEPKRVKAEQMERIRQAYFVDRKSIKQIAREFHHDRRTIRKAIYPLMLQIRDGELEEAKLAAATV